MKNKVSVDQMRGVVAAMAAVSMTAIMFYSPSVICTLLLSSAVGMGLALADLATQFANGDKTLVNVTAEKAVAKVTNKK
jgi:hypothetical protein